MAKVFSDFMKEGILARYGSDQFVCITYGEMDLSVETVEERVKKIVEEAPK